MGAKYYFINSSKKKISSSSWEAYTNFGRDSTNIDVKEWVIEWVNITLESYYLLPLTLMVSQSVLTLNYTSKCQNLLKYLWLHVVVWQTQSYKRTKNYANVDAISISKALHYEKFKISEIKKYIKQLYDWQYCDYWLWSRNILSIKNAIEFNGYKPIVSKIQMILKMHRT